MPKRSKGQGLIDTHITIREEVYKAARIACITRGEVLSQVIEALLENWLKEKGVKGDD